MVGLDRLFSCHKYEQCLHLFVVVIVIVVVVVCSFRLYKDNTKVENILEIFKNTYLKNVNHFNNLLHNIRTKIKNFPGNITISKKEVQEKGKVTSSNIKVL